MYWPARNWSRSFAGSLQMQRHHVVGEPLHLLHAARQRADRDVARRADGPRLDHEVAERLRLAEERLALRFFLLGAAPSSGRCRSRPGLRDLALAGAAGAVTAAVGQHQVLAQRRREDRFALLDVEFVSAGLDLDLTHKMQA